MTGPGLTAVRAVHEVAECHWAWFKLHVKGICEVLSTSTEGADGYAFNSAVAHPSSSAHMSVYSRG